MRKNLALSRLCCTNVLEVEIPDAAFYLWARVKDKSISDTDFAIKLYRDLSITVLPGSFLAREAHGFNPGENIYSHGFGGQRRGMY